MENTLDIMVRLSESFWSAESIEELSRLRDECRAEVKELPRESQKWLLAEIESAQFWLENPGLITSEEFDKIIKKVARDESKWKGSKVSRKQGITRTRKKGSKNRDADSFALWKEAFPKS